MREWLLEIQQLSFSLEELKMFPIPDVVPNSIWGCLVIVDQELDGRSVGKHELCQRISPTFYIPEKSTVHPYLTESDKATLFAKSTHILHPEFGLVELDESFNVEDILLIPRERIQHIIQPEEATFIPTTIKSFQLRSTGPETILEDLEKSFPKNEPLPNKPLNSIEKARRTFYKAFFQEPPPPNTENIRMTKLGKKLKQLLTGTLGTENVWLRRMEKDFEDLEKRNQKQLDKLLDLLKDNPAEALKYAIPLDFAGTSRGKNQGPQPLYLFKRWSNFSLFEKSSLNEGMGGTHKFSDQDFQRLNAQYEKTAQELIARHEYKQAAFVYMRLLKNYYKAATTLEDGGLYQEAAIIYLKHINNKAKAAECYENANMIGEAIPLYEELRNFNRVGDLYMKLHRRDAAMRFYEKSAQVSISARKYIAASKIYQEKIGDQQEAQRLLLQGWENDSNAYNCLKRYLANISDMDILMKELDSLYSLKVHDRNRELFLRVILSEFEKKSPVQEHLKELGYKIIASMVHWNPTIVNELRKFNLTDRELHKDIARFQA